jgi:hypothetical protein
VAGGILLAGRGPETAVLPSTGPGATASPGAGTGEGTRADDAAALLTRLTRALRDGSRADVVALAAPGVPGAARELGTIRENVRTLGLTDLSLRYVDEDDASPTTGSARELGDRAWVGDVRLGWRVAGFDTAGSSREVALTFVETPSGAAFVTARQDNGSATPLWLLDRLDTRATPRSLVVTTGGTSPARFSGLADRAVTAVRKVLPRWRGRVVVEVPADAQQLGRVLGAAPDEYGGIAAVTTTVDGSVSPTAPVHIFVNPAVFDPLGPRGAQIVMSHEATHVATGAAVSSMPTWLLEGFADYVALDHVDLPVSLAASQVLARVRAHGPPARLPGPHEFDPHSLVLGASYESAWLACRLIGERYGEARLVEFYRAADRAGSTGSAFGRLLHTDQPTFTRTWRRYLRQLAG